jgi:hypothetical protein
VVAEVVVTVVLVPVVVGADVVTEAGVVLEQSTLPTNKVEIILKMRD